MVKTKGTRGLGLTWVNSLNAVHGVGEERVAVPFMLQSQLNDSVLAQIWYVIICLVQCLYFTDL